MLTKNQLNKYRNKAVEYLNKAGIVLRLDEVEKMEIADFGLGEPEKTGLEVVVYVNTERVCAKELVLFPHQTCPEHRHPSVVGKPGKEEIFRCRWGKIYLFVPGPKTPNSGAKPPEGREGSYTVWQEVVLNPGEQYTLPPDTLHWFQSGDDGAVVSEFSTTSCDEMDIFTYFKIKRLTIVKCAVPAIRRRDKEGATAGRGVK